jgi:hypothetical protein
MRFVKEPLLDFVRGRIGITEVIDLVFFPTHINVILLHRMTVYFLLAFVL